MTCVSSMWISLANCYERASCYLLSVNVHQYKHDIAPRSLYDRLRIYSGPFAVTDSDSSYSPGWPTWRYCPCTRVDYVCDLTEAAAVRRWERAQPGTCGGVF